VEFLVGSQFRRAVRAGREVGRHRLRSAGGKLASGIIPQFFLIRMVSAKPAQLPSHAQISLVRVFRFRKSALGHWLISPTLAPGESGVLPANPDCQGPDILPPRVFFILLIGSPTGGGTSRPDFRKIFSQPAQYPRPAFLCSPWK
jgi:hypothetical protein